MFNKYLVTAALEIAAEHPQGFTVSPDMTEIPTQGYAVAVRETQNHFGVVGFLRALAYALENNLHLGGWLDEKTGDYYFDAVKVFPEGKLNEAFAFAVDNQQLAFFDIGNGVVIECK